MTGYLQHLPNELHCLILECLPDPLDQQSLRLALEQVDTILNNSESRRCIQKNLAKSLFGGCLGDALAVVQCPNWKSTVPDLSQQMVISLIKDHLRRWRKEEFHNNINIDDPKLYESLWILRQVIDCLVDHWVRRIRKRRSMQEGGKETLTQSEYDRFARGFCRYELYCRAFFHDSNLDPLFDYVTRSALMFDANQSWGVQKMPLWQVEEVSCVMAFSCNFYAQKLKQNEQAFIQDYAAHSSPMTCNKEGLRGWLNDKIDGNSRHLEECVINPFSLPQFEYLASYDYFYHDWASTSGSYSPHTNLIGGMVSLGLKGMYRYQSTLETYGCSKLAVMAEGFNNATLSQPGRMYDDLLGRCLNWDPGHTTQQFEDNRFMGDNLASRNQSWFTYHDFLHKEGYFYEDINVILPSLNIKPTSFLRDQAWVFWDAESCGALNLDSGEMMKAMNDMKWRPWTGPVFSSWVVNHPRTIGSWDLIQLTFKWGGAQPWSSQILACFWRDNLDIHV